MPKSTTYRITLDNGQRVEHTADSCAEAIESALWDNRGTKVVAVHAGLTREEIEQWRKIDKAYDRATPGIIDFTPDIPPHEAISEDAIKPKIRPRFKDRTDRLFDDAEVVAQTDNAKSRFASA